MTPRFKSSKFDKIERLVHRQIMDGQRGLISLAEVAVLEDKVARKMQAKFDEIDDLMATVPYLPGNISKDDSYTGVQKS